MKFKYCKLCNKWHSWEELGLSWYKSRQRWYIYCMLQKSIGVKRWHRANPGRVKEIHKKWRDNNPDKVRENNLKWREANPDKAKANYRKRAETQRIANIERYLDEYGDYCKKCKKQYPWHIYEFHHVDPSKKEKTIQLHLPWKSIEKEIKKCILVCANCHKNIHHIL